MEPSVLIKLRSCNSSSKERHKNGKRVMATSSHRATTSPCPLHATQGHPQRGQVSALVGRPHPGVHGAAGWKQKLKRGKKKVPNLVLGTAAVQKALPRRRLDTRPQAPRADGDKEHSGHQVLEERGCSLQADHAGYFRGRELATKPPSASTSPGPRGKENLLKSQILPAGSAAPRAPRG